MKLSCSRDREIFMRKRGMHWRHPRGRHLKCPCIRKKKKKNAVRTLRDIRMATWMTIDARTARTAACSNRSPKWRGDSVAPLRITAQCIPFRAQYERCGPRLQFRPAPRGCLRILFVAELRSWTFRTSHLLCICVCSVCAREKWHHTQWFNNLNILYFLLSKSISWHTWAHTHK